LAVLKKNGKKLAIDPARGEPGEALRAEFEGSVSKLGPLREKIERTDRLIDAVVYRLYGLTKRRSGLWKEFMNDEGWTPLVLVLFTGM